jgi:hypothetical protein
MLRLKLVIWRFHKLASEKKSLKVIPLACGTCSIHTLYKPDDMDMMYLRKFHIKADSINKDKLEEEFLQAVIKSFADSVPESNIRARFKGPFRQLLKAFGNHPLSLRIFVTVVSRYPKYFKSPTENGNTINSTNDEDVALQISSLYRRATETIRFEVFPATRLHSWFSSLPRFQFMGIDVVKRRSFATVTLPIVQKVINCVVGKIEVFPSEVVARTQMLHYSREIDAEVDQCIIDEKTVEDDGRNKTKKPKVTEDKFEKAFQEDIRGIGSNREKNKFGFRVFRLYFLYSVIYS